MPFAAKRFLNFISAQDGGRLLSKPFLSLRVWRRGQTSAVVPPGGAPASCGLEGWAEAAGGGVGPGTNLPQPDSHRPEFQAIFKTKPGGAPGWLSH